MLILSIFPQLLSPPFFQSRAAVLSVLAHEAGHVLWHERVLFESAGRCYLDEINRTWDNLYIPHWKRFGEKGGGRDVNKLKGDVPHPHEADDQADSGTLPDAKEAAEKIKRIFDTKQF